MNSKVRLLQVDERRESSGGSVAVLHPKTAEGRIIVRLLGALKNQPSVFPETLTISIFSHLLQSIVSNVLLQLIVFTNHAKEQEAEHDAEAYEDHLTGVPI